MVFGFACWDLLLCVRSPVSLAGLAVCGESLEMRVCLRGEYLSGKSGSSVLKVLLIFLPFLLSGDELVLSVLGVFQRLLRLSDGLTGARVFAPQSREDVRQPQLPVHRVDFGERRADLQRGLPVDVLRAGFEQ